MFLLILSACVGAAQIDVYVVPFSHFDLFWAGTKEECLSRGNRIITKAVQLATQYPEFCFLVEDEVWMANYLKSHRGLPEVSVLKQLVKERRIELAPKWAGIYQNMPRGEAHVEIQDNRRITGWQKCKTGFTVFFQAEFSKPFSPFGTWKDGAIHLDSSTQSGHPIGAFVDYTTSERETVHKYPGQ